MAHDEHPAAGSRHQRVAPPQLAMVPPMKLKRSVALAIGVGLVVLVVLLAWWLRSRKSHPRITGSPTAAPSPSASASPATPPGAGAAPAPAQPPPELRLRHDKDPQGNLRLEGQVIDAGKLGVGGVTVTLSSHPPRTTTSEGDGSFSFAELLARPYTVAARAPDGSLGGPVTVRVNVTTEPVVLTLRASSALEVTVLDGATRAPIAGAHVLLRALVEIAADTGADGKTTLRGLPASMVMLEVSAPGYGPEQTLVDPSGRAGEVDRTTVLLARGAGVSGRVIDAAGAPVAGAAVTAERAAALIPIVDGRAFTIETDAAGKFEFAALPAGSFRFAAIHEPLAPGSTPPVLLDGKTPVRGLEIRLQTGAQVVGHVVNQTGEPVPFAAVRVAPRQAGFLAGPPRQASCDAAGHFELTGLPRREIELVALHDSGSSPIVRVDLAADPVRLDVTLTLELALIITGTVVTPAGQPVPGAQVTAMPELDGKQDLSDFRLRGPASDVSDGAGWFRLPGLAPGRYRVRAAQDSGPDSRDLWLRAGQVVNAGDRAVRLVLEDDGAVKGRVVYSDGTTPELFSVAPGAFSPAVPFAGTGGSFRLGGVPAGERTLVITGPRIARFLTQPIRVSAGGETDAGEIRIERGRSVRGLVVDDSGRPVAGAKVMAGGSLIGDGSQVGVVPMPAMGSKETTSADDGSFEIAGVGPGRLAVVADSGSARSVIAAVAPGPDDVALTLRLMPTGALEGKVTQAGAPLPGAIVTAQQVGAAGAKLVVTAGADGGYRFDRLGAGEYVVAALRMQGIGGADMQSTRVRVSAGGTAHQDLELPSGGVTVELTVTRPPGQTLDNAMVALIAGRIDAHTGAELEDAVARLGDAGLHQGMLLAGGGKVLRMEHVTRGDYSVCVLLIAGNLMDPKVAEQLQRSPETLPVTCLPRKVANAPAVQQITVEIP